MDIFHSICDIIVLVSAVLIAIKNIAEWFGKPIKFFQKKKDEELDTKIVGVIKRELPPILKAHDLETRDKYRADRNQFLHDIQDEVLKNIQGKLTQVEQLTAQYEALVISAKDVIREKIMIIYHNNKENKTLSVFESEALEQYYKDYKAMNGNSYIDKYYGRMKDWPRRNDD